MHKEQNHQLTAGWDNPETLLAVNKAVALAALVIGLSAVPVLAYLGLPGTVGLVLALSSGLVLGGFGNYFEIRLQNSGGGELKDSTRGKRELFHRQTSLQGGRKIDGFYRWKCLLLLSVAVGVWFVVEARASRGYGGIQAVILSCTGIFACSYGFMMNRLFPEEIFPEIRQAGILMMLSLASAASILLGAELWNAINDPDLIPFPTNPFGIMTVALAVFVIRKNKQTDWLNIPPVRKKAYFLSLGVAALAAGVFLFIIAPMAAVPGFSPGFHILMIVVVALWFLGAAIRPWLSPRGQDVADFVMACLITVHVLLIFWHTYSRIG